MRNMALRAASQSSTHRNCYLLTQTLRLAHRGVRSCRRNGWQPFRQSASPLDLSMERGYSIKVWTRRWERFFRLSYLDAQPQMTQYDVLVSCIADNTLKVVDYFDLASDKKHDVTSTNTLECYAKGQLNETVKHHNPLSRVQEPGERCDDFFFYYSGQQQRKEKDQRRFRGRYKRTNQILFSFSSDKDRRIDSRIRRKNAAQPRQESNPGSCEF